MSDTPIAIPHVHQWFTMPAMKVGQGRCMTCGMWSQEFDAQAAELAAALAELANVKDDFDTAIAQRDKLEKALIEVIGNPERANIVAFMAMKECGK